MSANTDLVQGAYDAFSRGDVGAVLGVLDERIEWSAPGTLPHGGQFGGPDGVGRFFAGLGAQWRELKLAVEAVADAGPDLVVGIVAATGTRSDGAPGRYDAVHLFTVQGGKVTRFREYTDLDGPLT